MNISSIHRIERLNYILGGVLVIAAALLASKVTALGVLVGVVLSCINFSVMKRILSGLMHNATQGSGGKSRTSGLFLVPKMALLMGAVVLALLFLPINAEGLAIGFSVFLVSIVIETVRFMSSQGAFPEDGESAIGDDTEAGDPET